MLLYFKGLLKHIVVYDLLFRSLYGVFTRDYFLLDLFRQFAFQLYQVYFKPASVDFYVFEYVDILE